MALSDFYVACPLGLEEVLADEVRALGAQELELRKGGLRCRAESEFGYRACLWLRCALRVQEQLISGRAVGEDPLKRLVDRIDWERYMGLDQTLAVDASLRDSRLTHSKFAALLVKDAIVDQFRARRGRRPDVDTRRPHLPLKLTLLRDQATVYREYSGASLHKRGYQAAQVRSPLNEALAAGLVRLSGWQGERPLMLPMCGAATFAVEAIGIVEGRAPGLDRRFAFESWPDLDRRLWGRLRSEARETARARVSVPVVASDRHPGAVGLARRSLEAAGCLGQVDLLEREVREHPMPDGPCTVLVNPPFGERLDPEDLEQSWRHLGNFLHGLPGGSEAWVLSGNAALTRLLGLRAERRIPVRNGPMDCRWLRYPISADRSGVGRKAP